MTSVNTHTLKHYKVITPLLRSFQRHKAIIGKMWRKIWVTLDADGTLTVANQITSKRRGRQKYDLRRDCMYVRTASQCQHLLPPSEVEDKANLIELLLTGDRRLALCGLASEETDLWIKCIETARSEQDKPSMPMRVSSLAALDDVPEERGFKLRCCMCVRPSSKVKAIDYRPTTKQSSSGSLQKTASYFLEQTRQHD
ncbi:hypothetical protein ACOMHN_005804 [Nucella lapillus]